jgi:hypothetical protein
VPRIIWSNPGNPTRAVSDALGIERWQPRSALHRIKEDAGLSGADRVIVWDDGTVSDTQGNTLGNIYDEI